MPLAITLHLLSAVIWVGGMFFAYMALRPVASQLLEPPMRLTLWAQVLGRFFPWVGLAILLLLITGFWMVFGLLGGMARVGMHVHLMMSLGIVMILIFAHIYYRSFARLKDAVGQADWLQGARSLKQIRLLIAVNLCLGLLVVCIAAVGPYMKPL